LENTVVGQIEKIMFKNSDSDNDTKVGHMSSGRTFKEVPLVDLFEKDHEPLPHEEGF
jgi:hypothetical protein